MATNNVAWAWGVNGFGQHGDQTRTDHSSPVAVVGAHSFVAIAGGYQSAAGIKEDGSCWAWGSGASGALGDQTTVSKSSPVLVVGNHQFTQIVGGYGGASTFLGLKSADGSVWAWGNNDVGQLGDQTTTAKSSPVVVVGAHSFTSVKIAQGTNSGGGNFVLGLKADGSVWAWGANNAGQLGDQTTTGKSSPVLVVGAHSFVEIAAGFQTALARKADGSVWSWGSNDSGALGAHQGANCSSPVLVVGAHSFTKITGAGNNLAAALKADGTCWAWGDNSVGGVGDQTITNRSSPTLVVGAHTFVAITGGTAGFCALKATGQAWAWGQATSGALGDQTTTNKSSPVLVVGAMTFAAVDAGHFFYAAIQGVPPVTGGAASATRGFFFGA